MRSTTRPLSTDEKFGLFMVYSDCDGSARYTRDLLYPNERERETKMRAKCSFVVIRNALGFHVLAEKRPAFGFSDSHYLRMATVRA